MSGRNVGGWNPPFEEQPIVESDTGLVAQALVVMAAVAPTPLGTFPAVIFRFEVPGLSEMPTVTLLLDAEHMRGVPGLVAAAVNASIRRAGQGT